MGQRILGTVLLLLALFMLVGFLRSGGVGGAARLVAFLIAVVAPAAGGLYLWWSASASRSAALAEQRRRRSLLTRRTLEAELLKLAERRGGKLTVVEGVAELAYDAETVEETLKDMAAQGLAEIEIAESGMLVYAFRDVRALHEKADAKGVLDA